MSEVSLTQKAVRRFWSKVALTANPDLCWEWKAGCFSDGYGAFYVNPKLVGAHCFAWILANGAISEGLLVMHSCDNRKCCNPKHLSLGTIQANQQDMMNKGRQAKGEGHGRHKLTASQVAGIRRRYADGGISKRNLADEMGVSQMTIHSIVIGKTWKEINILGDES